MAFKMKKRSIIQGTEEHSALLATAEMTRTHGGDTSIIGAAGLYGKSNSPDVIDYSIKQTQIKWDKKKKEEEEEEVVVGCTDPNAINYNSNATESDGSCEYDKEPVLEEEIDYDDLFEEEEDDPDDYPGGPDDPNLNSNDQKKINAHHDKIIAINKLKAIHLPVKKPSEELIKSKKFPKATTTGAIVQSVGGESAHNLKTSYTKEEQTRLIFSEKHGRMVLPKEIGKESDVIVESKKLDKELTKATKKSQKKKETTKTTTKSQDLKYKLKGPAGRKKMRDEGYEPPKNGTETNGEGGEKLKSFLSRLFKGKEK